MKRKLSEIKTVNREPVSDQEACLDSLTTLILEDLPPTEVNREGPSPIGALVANRYRILEVVGKGGAGMVFRVLDEEAQEQRAMKILRPDLASRERLLKRMASEAVAMTLLHHPNILKVYDMGTDEPFHFVVLEWANGGSVAERIADDRLFSPEEAAWIGMQVLAALEVAHERDIIHRDIKPGNILLDGEGRAMLGDFGIARFPHAEGVQTAIGTVLGSMAFMPPEQRVGPDAVVPASDLYALGATLFRMLTGDNPVDLFLNEADEPRWLGIPPSMRDVLVRATRMKPADRFPDAASMARALHRAYPSSQTPDGSGTTTARG